jgi:hypothetical protein
MTSLRGTILILAGSVLFGACIIADSLRGSSLPGNLGYLLGGIIGIAGIALLVGPTLKQSLDSGP